MKLFVFGGGAAAHLLHEFAELGLRGEAVFGGNLLEAQFAGEQLRLNLLYQVVIYELFWGSSRYCLCYLAEISWRYAKPAGVVFNIVAGRALCSDCIHQCVVYLKLSRRDIARDRSVAVVQKCSSLSQLKISTTQILTKQYVYIIPNHYQK